MYKCVGSILTSINSNISINNPFKPQGKKDVKETELGLFYTNDMHGDVNRLAKFKTAHDTFKKANKNTPNLTLSAGDCLFGTDKQRNSLMVKLFNIMGLDALALGNHEFAGGSKNLSDSLKNAKFTSVSANLELDENKPLKDRIKDKKLVKSAVFMKGGHKFAVIGASPFDSYINTVDKTVKPMEIDRTIKAINEEAKSLEKQGVNKIILCSHLGYGEDADLKVARETEGIDIIVGGHTHTTIDGVNKQNNGGTHKLNLLMSKRNEPVIITQAGGMNQKVGYLNVLFDEKGVIKTESIKNNLLDVNMFTESKVAQDLMNKELGRKIELATVKGNYAPNSSYRERYLENPLHNAFADALLDCGKKYGAEISLFQASTMRGGANKNITNYDIKYSMLPFNNELKLVDITEKDLVEVLKNTSGSILTSDKDTQLVRCAGMNYSVRNDKEYFLNGGKSPIEALNIQGRDIDVKNPSETKTVKAVMTNFLFSMPTTKNIMAKYLNSAKTIGNEQGALSDYLTKVGSVDMNKQEQRIKLSTTYSSYDDLIATRKEVMTNLC